MEVLSSVFVLWRARASPSTGLYWWPGSLTLANIKQNIAASVTHAGAVSIAAAFGALPAHVPGVSRVGGVKAVIRAPVAVARPTRDVRSLGVGPSTPVAGPVVAAVGNPTMVTLLHVYVFGDAVELASRSAHVLVIGAGGVPAAGEGVRPHRECASPSAHNQQAVRGVQLGCWLRWGCKQTRQVPHPEMRWLRGPCRLKYRERVLTRSLPEILGVTPGPPRRREVALHPHPLGRQGGYGRGAVPPRLNSAAGRLGSVGAGHLPAAQLAVGIGPPAGHSASDALAHQRPAAAVCGPGWRLHTRARVGNMLDREVKQAGIHSSLNWGLLTSRRSTSWSRRGPGDNTSPT